MRIVLLFLLVVFVASSASAGEYGQYDPKRVLGVTEAPSGKRYGFDLIYFDKILNDLSAHAKNYPPQFATPQDRQRATRDVKVLSGMLDVLLDTPSPDPELLLRAAYLNSIGHNLDIPGAGEKANATFVRLLAAKPADPRGNYMYGTFLAGVGKPGEALPYLEKARSAGVTDAAYTIGMAYLSLGDREQALTNLEEYKRRKPGDGSVDNLIEAIHNGKIKIKKKP